MRQQFAVFVVRWMLNSVGIWVAISILGHYHGGITNTAAVMTFVVAGLIFSVVNSVLKPIVVILSLPAILLTLGLFTLVVNGLMVYLSLALAPGLSMTFGASILAGIILSLVNYIVSSALDLKAAPQR
ncbi:MAG: phage holin family protein [Candidatus Saccharibacteria bacterium]|nr:phage holin family protein [Candidatus Saccharibacteria bacterium]